MKSVEHDSKVFISYSRKDRDQVEPIIAALKAANIHVLRDTDDILPTEEWRARLEDLIVEADQVVFALSPHSAASEVCAWEAEFAEQLNKRIAPIVVSDLGDVQVPISLSKLNYLFLTAPADPDAVLVNLRDALLLDIDWIREHTRLGELGRRWEKSGHRDDLHLRGKALEAAEVWIAMQPPDAPAPTALHMQFITSSRQASTRRLRRNVVVLGGLLIAAIGATVLAWLQYQDAQENARIALEQEHLALENERVAREQEQVARENAEIARDEANFSSSFTAMVLNTATDPMRDEPRIAPQKDCEHVLYRDDNGNMVRYGLLATFCAIRDVLGIDSLEALSGEPIFTSGPHAGDTLKVSDLRDFGRYNPAFVRWFSQRILPDSDDTAFIASTQALYDEFAKYMVRSFYLTYISCANHPDFFEYERRLLELQVADDPGGVRPLRNNTDGPSLLDFYKIDSEFHKIVFDFRAIGFDDDQITHLSSNSFNKQLYDLRAPIRFWTRRSVDGTADLIFQALRKLVRAYDAEFKASYEDKNLADVSLPARDDGPHALPVLSALPFKYRKPWGENGELMPERY